MHMAFVDPSFSKNQVNRAGEILAAPDSFDIGEQSWAAEVLANWRHCCPKQDRVELMNTENTGQ